MKATTKLELHEATDKDTKMELPQEFIVQTKNGIFNLTAHFAGLGYNVFQDGKKIGNISSSNIRDNFDSGFYKFV